MIAHVGGVPTEELVLPAASWAGAGLVLARAWLASRLAATPPTVGLTLEQPAWGGARAAGMMRR